MYAVTGASGQLGRLVLEELIQTTDAGKIVALVRDPSKLSDLAAKGVVVRRFDYDDEATLGEALMGVDRLLLISSSEVGRREAQHQAVITAAKAKNVGFITYTSLLHADSSPLGLAGEHRATEAAIEASGLSYALLRNGWYLENYTMSANMEIAHGAVIGSTGTGRVSAASRVDYAAAAAKVLLEQSDGKQVYELAGDDSFTLSDYAKTLAEVSGKPVIYQHLGEDDFRSALQGMGLPAAVADMVANSSASAASDALFDDNRALSKLIGRPTTTLSTAVAAALA
jgi:NAD(P)H dehydrogenase (quinone)